MPRIFKGSESTLRLLLHTCTQEGAISELKIALFTNDPSVAVEFTDRYTIDGCFVNIVVPNYAFGNMEDGVINYRAEGMIDDDTFITERQSNYFLKTPSNYTPTEIPKELKLEKLKETIKKVGIYKYFPSDGYEGFSSVEITSFIESNYYSVDEAIAKLDENPSKVFYDSVVLGYARNINVDEKYINFELYGENDRYIKVLELRVNEVPSSIEEGDIVVLFGEFYDYKMVGVGCEIVDVIKGAKQCVLDHYVGKFEDMNGEGKWWIYAKYNGVDGFDYVDIDASEYGQTKYNEGYEQGKSEGGGCNLEDKIIAPETNEVDGSGYIYIRPNEGYDGLMEVALQTNNLKNDWYSEGYEQGKAEGGGGNCNLGHQLEIIETNGRHIFYPQNNGWDGYDFFEVEVQVPTEGGNLEDKWVTPTASDVDGNGYIVVNPSEGYNGMGRVVVDASHISYFTNGAMTALNTIYNSNYEFLSERDAFSSNLELYLTDPSNTSLSYYFNGLNTNYKYYSIEGTENYSNNITDIRMLYDGNGNCSVMNWGGMQCHNVEYCEDAFQKWSDLVIIGKLEGLGENFGSPQTLSFEDSPLLFKDTSRYFPYTFVNSLFDFSQGGNSKGVTNSYIKFHPNTILDGEARNMLIRKGWEIIEN